MARLSFRLIVFWCGAVLLAGCGSSPSQPADGIRFSGLPMHLLSVEGPAVGGVGQQNRNSVHVLSATDIADVRALAAAVGDLLPHECDNAQSPDTGKECWASVASSSRSLFLAIDLVQPCTNVMVTSTLRQSQLTVSARYTDVSCTSGHSTAVAPTLSLLGMPIDQLPKSVLTVIFNQGVGGPEWRSVVDLRQPFPGPSSATAYQDVHAAIQQIEQTGRPDLQVVGLGFRTWSDASLDCSGGKVGSSAGAEAGYVLVVKTLGRGIEVYQWASGKLVGCGTTSP
jgi:hypothetical protein